MNRPHASFACTAALLSVTALAFALAGPKVPITLTLTAPKRPLKAGTRFILPIKVTNASDQTTLVPVSMSPYGYNVVYRVYLRDQRGQAVPHRPASPQMRNGSVIHAGSTQSRNMAPGKSYMDHVDVTYCYDLSRPGKYKIWITEGLYFAPHHTRVVPGPNRIILPNTIIKSNVITLTVVR